MSRLSHALARNADQKGVTIVRELRNGFGGEHEIWEIRRDGAFVIGAQTPEAAQRRVEQLEANGWRYLDCYDRGHPEPLAWIGHVRAQGWNFESHSEIEIGKDGRAFFGGNIKEYSAAFKYLLLDSELLEQVRQAAPEVECRKPQFP